MSREEDYDNIIAPMLLEVAQKCDALGFSLVARVEWEPGNAGITQIGNGPDTGAAQQLAYAAAMCRGNVDALLGHLIKKENVVSQSLYLSVLTRGLHG